MNESVMNEKINDAAKKSALERLTELDKVNMMDALMFDTKEYKNGFKRGVRWAFRELREQIAYCTTDKKRFPMLHLLNYIDKMLGEDRYGQKDTK